MLDRAANAALMPLFQVIARALVRAGVGADAVTIGGFCIGIAAAVSIALQSYALGLALLLTSRLADGLDGPVARLTQATDRGAFLDITLDFLFYASIPLAFAIANPAANALPAAVLLAAFIGTGSSFLAFAVFAQKRDIASSDYPNKGLLLPRRLDRSHRDADLLCADVPVARAFRVVGLRFCRACAR